MLGLLFNGVPVFQDILCGIRLHRAEHMGMPDDHFLADLCADILQREVRLFLLDLCVEHHLQKQVAQLLPQHRRIFLVDCLDHLISLLNQLAADGLVGLFPIPWAALFAAKE